MFTVWDVSTVGASYDWQRVARVPSEQRLDAWDDQEREPGELPSQTHPELKPPRLDPYARQQARQQPRARRRARTVSELMSHPVVTLTTDDSIGTAWDLISDRGFRHVPVVGAEGTPEAGRLVGMVSDRDLLRVAGTPDHQPQGDVRGRALRTLMSTPVLAAAPDTPVREAARVMFEAMAGSLPVVSENGQLEGILTSSDILRSLVAQAPLEVWI